MTGQPVVCAPTPWEANPLSGALGPDRVWCTGPGPWLSRRASSTRRARTATGVAVVGIAAGVQTYLRPGDVVVATEVHGPDGQLVRLAGAALLAAELRRRGLTVYLGPVASVSHVVRHDERLRLAAAGVLCADMESVWLLEQASTPAIAVVRVVADPASAPLLRPATWGRVRHALGILDIVAPAVSRWEEAVSSRQLLLAAPRSFCAGVVRAIDIVERALEQRGRPVYVRKQIVHNTHVVAALEARGAVFVDELAQVPRGATVVFSAHGISPQVRREATTRGLEVIDATCPLVTKVHAEIRRFADRGDTVIFIGHHGHEETEGTMGERPGRSILVENVEQARSVTVPDSARVSYLVQTTLAIDEVQDIIDVLRRRFPDLRAPDSDDICYATTNRQQGLLSVAVDADLVLVVGSPNSSNSNRLVERARRLGKPAHLIDDIADVHVSWLIGATTVAITAGASAPASAVDTLVAALGGLGPVDVVERTFTTENLRFTVPKEVRTA